MKVTLMMCFKQYILQLYRTYKTFSGKGPGWITDSVIDDTISIWKYNRLAGSNYTELPKELNHSRKGLIHIQNIDDNECSKLCLFRYLNPIDHNPVRITKVDKDFGKKLYFKDIKFQVKVSDIHKIEKKKCIGIGVFVYENIEKYPIYVSRKKGCEEKLVDLLLVKEKGKRHYVLIKDLNTFMYNHTSHRWKNISAITVYKLIVQKKY